MAFTFPWHWLGFARRTRPDLHIVVFTRPACPLCDEAWDLLKRHQNIYEFSLSLTNIEDSVDLVRAHGEWIPVVMINGTIRFRGHINDVLLRRILDA